VNFFRLWLVLATGTTIPDSGSDAMNLKNDTHSKGMLSRGGPALAVIGIHIIVIYVMAVSMGVIDVPKSVQPLEAVFIPETTESKPEPVPAVKPDIPELEQPVDQSLPEVAFDEPIAPPTDNPMPASDNALVASANAPAADLKTATRVEPAYPAISRRMGEEGQVQLRVLVDESGKPKDVQVIKGSGFDRLDQAAKDAVRQWRFKAASDGSKNIMAWTQVAITFKLTADG
jgi:protein TonB